MDICSEESKNKFLIAYSEIMKSLENKVIGTNDISQNKKNKDFITKYGTAEALPLQELGEIEIKASDIEMKNYISIFNENGKFSPKKLIKNLKFNKNSRNFRFFINDLLFSGSDQRV